MDATERVFLGQDNTGDALVYGGMGDTNLKLLNSTLSKNNRPSASGETSKSKKTASAEDLKPDYYYQWTAEFQPKLNQLDEIGSQFYAKGIDPYDPSAGQIYVEFQKEKNKLANDMQVSNQLGKYHTSVMQQINQGDKKYSKDSVEAINKYFNRPFNEVKKDLMAGNVPPQLQEDTTFSFTDYAKNIKEAVSEEEDFVNLGVKDGIQSELVVKQRRKEKIDPIVEMDYLNNQNTKVYYDSFYETLNPGTKAYWEEQAKKLGKKPQVLAAQDLVHRTVEGKKVSKNNHNINDNYYWGSKDGQGKIDKRKKIINTILTGVDKAPNGKVKTEAKRELSNLFVGKEVGGVTVNDIEVEDGIVYGNGTIKSSNPYGGGTTVQPQRIKLLDLKDRGTRSARLINQLLNESGLEEIPSDYFDQMLEESEIIIAPVGKTKTATPKTETKKSVYED